MCERPFYQPKTQSNHYGYRIPAEVECLQGKPLYLLVAYWGMMHERGFTRQEVAEAFGLHGRRAANIMRYISRKQDAIIYERFLESIEYRTRNRRVVLKILALHTIERKNALYRNK